MLYLWLVLFGLAIGSFVNVVIARVPSGRSLTGRSACPHCGHTLAWYDLIPLVSFIWLRRRCRYCQRSISWQYFFVELYAGLVFPLSYRLLAGAGLSNWLYALFFLMLFLTLFAIDLEHQLLPNGLIVAGLIVAIAYATWFRLWSADRLLAAALLFLFFFLLWYFSHGTWLGLGDAKLALLVGLIFGLNGGIIVIYTAITLGAFLGLLLLLFRRAGLKTRLPLGSFITLTASLYLLWGNAIIKLDIPVYILKLFK